MNPFASFDVFLKLLKHNEWNFYEFLHAFIFTNYWKLKCDLPSANFAMCWQKISRSQHHNSRTRFLHRMNTNFNQIDKATYAYAHTIWAEVVL